MVYLQKKCVQTLCNKMIKTVNKFSHRSLHHAIGDQPGLWRPCNTSSWHQSLQQLMLMWYLRSVSLVMMEETLAGHRAVGTESWPAG